MSEAIEMCCDICDICDLKLNPQQFKKLKNILPRGYNLRVCSYEEEEDGFCVRMRVKLNSEAEAKEWVSKFQDSSKTTMRVDKTYPKSGLRNDFKIDYRCQHKTRTPARKQASKNTGCSAKITVIIKRTDQQRPRYSDLHLPELPMIICLNFIHNHQINCPDALRHRDVSEEVKQKFLLLYEAGHNPASALKIHKNDLQREFLDDFIYISADRAIVPDLQWCYRLFYATSKAVRETVGPEAVKKELEVPTAEEVSKVKEELKSYFTALESKLDTKPATFLPAIRTFLNNGKKLKAESSVMSALMTYGKYSALNQYFGTKNKLTSQKRKRGPSEGPKKTKVSGKTKKRIQVPEDECKPLKQMTSHIIYSPVTSSTTTTPTIVSDEVPAPITINGSSTIVSTTSHDNQPTYSTLHAMAPALSQTQSHHPPPPAAHTHGPPPPPLGGSSHFQTVLHSQAPPSHPHIGSPQIQILPPNSQAGSIHTQEASQTQVAPHPNTAPPHHQAASHPQASNIFYFDGVYFH